MTPRALDCGLAAAADGESGMIELFTWATPNGTRPAIMLEEAGLPYTVRLIDIAAGAQFSPEFRTISPNSKIPALIDCDAISGRRVLFESGAILIYLAEKSGMLSASDGRRRDAALSWLFWSTSGLGPALGRFPRTAAGLSRMHWRPKSPD